MQTFLVTGANRGLGLALCRLLTRRGDEVFAACRSASDALRALDVTLLEGVDVTDPEAVQRLALELDAIDLDVLVHNAGIYERAELDQLDEGAYADMTRMFETNAVAPLRLTRALLENLDRGAKVVLVTSLMGAMGDNQRGGSYGYRMSKAAANAAGVSLARDLAERGIAVGMLHPGMVATDMTGGRGLPVEESAAGLLARIDELSLATSGSFRHQDGRDLPW